MCPNVCSEKGVLRELGILVPFRILTMQYLVVAFGYVPVLALQGEEKLATLAVLYSPYICVLSLAFRCKLSPG